MTEGSTPIDRRQFLQGCAACSAHIALLASASPVGAARAFAAAQDSNVVVREPWARIEEVADGIWAVISTPLEDRTTICNGGIIRGSGGVLVVESFASPDGATWAAEQARTLTGRWPDAIVLTHYHSDHTGGLAGYATDADTWPPTHSTAVTRDLVVAQDRQNDVDPQAVKERMLAGCTLIDPARQSTIDLGDRTVRVFPRDGHTKSDVTLEIIDPPVIFCGDLVWNRMFPNYMDAIPSHLDASVRSLLMDRFDTVYVPGHGALASASDIFTYIRVLNAVEEAARQAVTSGTTAAAAAESFTLPDSVGEWTLFSPRYYETAINAWIKELRPDGA
ncbi:MAG: MBL fold metallo-hydrolase [Gemmatimonadota bacterium]|jgi:glyoxylase-like metal-dependent hydrolase (beta-lactamase superfamily II)